MKLAATFILIFLAMLVQAHAQACGAFYVHIAVKDSTGKPIPNADIAMLPGTKDETQGKKFVRDAKDPSAFVIAYSEGTMFTTPQTVSVSAAGFNTGDIPAIFTSCENLSASVKLSKKGSANAALWEFRSNVMAEADGPDGRFLSGAKLTVFDSNIEKHDVEGFDKGYAYFDLPNGKYTLKFSAPGYESRDENLDLTGLGRKAVVVQLKKVQGPASGDVDLAAQICSASKQLDDVGHTKLILAAAAGRDDLIPTILNCGVDVKAVGTDGVGVLFFGVDGGNVKVMELLLKAGAAVDGKTKDGVTALMYAARAGNDDIVKLLLANGADPKAKDVNGSTPMDYARETNRTSIIALLEKLTP